MISTKYALILALVGCVSAAQAQPSLAELVDQAGAEWMIGNWVSEGENGETISLSTAWALDKNVILLDRKDSRLEIKSMTAVDPQSGEVRYVGVSNHGGIILGTWTEESGNPVLKFKAHGRDGRSLKGAVVFKSGADQTLLAEYYPIDDSDNLVEPAKAKFVFKRKK